ncbi:hypothetical protein J4573_46110 [Actinomadura barringtoniae]|uniref:PH domain-containing protein n=1 Tax=Actinomadura barringtoniae TaxID=1427535 RepID=A0A939PTK7_9ACTN|nr:hypothetical protein [Actinomadura barringtoniae]MBO2454531.1 hypothetical protein [Actinomadura barringtoniae]
METTVVSLRPRWRTALITLPVLAAGPLLLVIGVQQPSLTAFAAGIGLTGYAVRNAMMVLRGFTEVWPDGLYNQLAAYPAEVAWERVERLIVMRTLFGRYVQVEERDGQRISLAAPRSGLITRTPDFDAHLTTIGAMPGGSRPPIPAQRTQPIPMIVSQAVLTFGICAAVLTAVLTY